MTISTTTLKTSYSGNGSTTAFAYTYPINTTSEITVIERSALGAETVKAEGTGSTNYGIVDNGAAGGTITMVTAPASGTTLIILRNTSLTQETDYVANDPFPAETHEDALDKLQMQNQELQEELDRSIKLSRTNTMTSTEFTVAAADRANKILAFDSSGEIAVTQELGTFKGNSATTTTAAYAIRDIVKSTTTAQLNNIYICIQTSPIGTALTNTSYWVLIVDAVSAASSATASANSATASANSATASANSATASANSNTASGNSATASANSATASANSATASAASFDSFDDRYLGAKSSAPSTDNDGNSLLTGALYFNSSQNIIYNWTGSAWQSIRPTSSEQTAINALAASAVITDMSLLATTDVIADMALLATSDVISDMNALAVSDVISDINTLATSDIVSDINLLATSDIVSDLNTLATSDIISDLNTLATSDIVSDINTLATSDIVSDLNLLGTSDFVSDLNVLGTSTNVTNMANLNASGVLTNISNLNGSGVINNIATAAGAISNINNVGGSIGAVNSAAANLASINNFGLVYRIASSAPSSSLNSGDLYFNTSTNVLNVYGASGWQNAGSSVNGTSNRFKFVASGTPTSFSGNDANGKSLSYDAGFIDVYLNGIKMVNGTDVTVTSGSAIVFASAVTNGDIIEAVAFGTFAVANLNASNLSSGTVPTARLSGAYTGITSLGTITSFRSTGIDDNSNALAITIDSSERVGIGTTAPDAQFQTNVASATIGGGRIYTNAVRTGVNSSSVFSVRADNASGSSNGDVVNIQGDGVGDLLVLSNNGTDRATFKADGKVGIGTASPAENLQIMDTVSNKPQLRLETSDGGNKRLDLYVDSGVGTIAADQSAQQLAFRTANSERMRIDSSGNVLVGKTAEERNNVGLELNPVGKAVITRSGGTTIELNRKSSDGELISFFKDNTGVGAIGVVAGDLNIYSSASNHGGLRFQIGGRIVPVNSSGVTTDNANDLGNTNQRYKDIYLGGGAFLGGQGAANKLDDYEEGTYTAGVFDANSGGNQSATTATGYYTKIGRLVNFNVAFSDINTTGLTGSNRIFVSLPFVSINGRTDAQTSPFVKNFSFGGYLIFGESSGSQKSRFGFISINNAASHTSTTVSNVTDDNNYCSISLTYFTD